MRQWFMSGVLSLIGYLSTAQQTTTLEVTIRDEHTGRQTPAMVCIRNLEDSSIVVPPDGNTAPLATFPQPFFAGILHSSSPSWFGPVRKTNGKGGVNMERTYVYGTSPSIPYWTDSLMYQVNGKFTIRLKPGRWKINIRRGMEFIPVSYEFTAKGGTMRKTVSLKRWIDLREKGWYSGDVHVHHALDKPSDTAYLLQLAEAEDLHLMNMLVMGDRWNVHFKSPAYGPGASMRKLDYWLAIGQEEPRSDYGHVIGLNIDTLARDTSRYNHYDVVFDNIHQRKTALVGYAHFAYRGEGVLKGMACYVPFGHVNFVELLQNTQLNREGYYDYLNMGFRLTATAGSDFPWGSTPGDGRTFVYTGKDFKPSTWFKGVMNANTFVSNGPALFFSANGKIPGNEIKSTGPSRVRLTLKAVSNPAIGNLIKVQIINSNGIVREETKRTGDSIVVEFDHTVQKSEWIAAYAECDNGAVAHTSPVFVLIGGKPAINKERLPALIANQMRVLDEIVADEQKKNVPDAGVLDRVKKAKQFYANMLKANGSGQ